VSSIEIIDTRVKKHIPVHLHKTEISVKLNDKFKYELLIENALREIQVNTTKEKSGEHYTVKSYKEDRGESITTYIDNQARGYKVLLITHKYNRIENYITLLNDLNLKYDFYTELYTRYHEFYELRVSQVLDALLKIFGKEQTVKKQMNKGKSIIYMNRLDGIELPHNAIIQFSLKTYRRKQYYRYSIENSEYHPKLELSLRIKNTTLLTSQLNKILEEHASIVASIIHFTKAKVVIGDYEKQSYTIHATPHSYIISHIKAGLLREKATTHLAKEIKDKREIILEYLKRGYKISEIMKILSIKSKSYIYYLIGQLEAEGIIEKTGRGKYKVKTTIPPQPRKPEILFMKIPRITLDQLIEYLKRGYKIDLPGGTTGTLLLVNPEEFANTGKIYSVKNAETYKIHNTIFIRINTYPPVEISHRELIEKTQIYDIITDHWKLLNNQNKK